MEPLSPFGKCGTHTNLNKSLFQLVFHRGKHGLDMNSDYH